MRSPHAQAPRPAPRSLTILHTLIPLVALLISGCGASSAGASLPSTSSTPAPTATSAPTPVPTADLAALSGPCAHAPTFSPRYQIGDVVVTEVRLPFLLAAAQQLTDGTPLQPFKLPSNDVNAEFPSSAPVNPNLQQGYTFIVCNAAPTQAHVIHDVSVRIASFTPYSGQLNAWQYCADGVFFRPEGARVPPVCGVIFSTYGEYLHATFPTDAGVGANVLAAQTGTGADPDSGEIPGPLPVTLAPGKFLSVDVSLAPPTAPGLYAFAFGLAVDGQPPAFFSTARPVLLAPVAHKWTGKACEAPAMQAQIPQTITNPPTQYICPES